MGATTPEPKIPQPYRIATTYKTRTTDGRSQIVAHTRGPVNPARLTQSYDHALTADENHERTARALAVKKSNRAWATVTQHSSNDAGTRRDWTVTA